VLQQLFYERRQMERQTGQRISKLDRQKYEAKEIPITQPARLWDKQVIVSAGA
jgi:hypothetical protein